MKHAIAGLSYLIGLLGWLAGIVLSKGPAVLFAIFLPPYAWYLVVEKAMQMAHMVE